MLKFFLLAFYLFVGTNLIAQDLTILVSDIISPYSGPVVELLEKGGYKVNLEVRPNARLMGELGYGMGDGAFFMSESAIATIKGLKKVPLVLFSTEIVAVSIDKTVEIKKPADLLRYHVGVIRGNPIHADLVKGAQVTEVVDDETILRMLGAQRFEVALMWRNSINFLRKKTKMTGLTVHEPALHVTPLYFVLTEKAHGEMNRITKIFKDALDSGWWKKEYAKLITPP